LKKSPVHSTFRTGYIIQIVFTVLAIAGAVYYFLTAGPFYRFRIPLIIISILGGLLILYLLFYHNLNKMTVGAEGISIKHIISGKKRFIPFRDITEISADTFQIKNVNGPLTEPVPEVEIKTRNKGSVFILSNVYGNFYPLVRAVLDGYNRMQDEKIDKLAEAIIREYLKNTYHGKREQKTD